MNSREVPLSFLCGKARLYAILHQPEQISSCGLLIVTGRPALRAGRHRLFVLLARTWAEAGIPVMRFDFRGTGDSEGEMGTIDDTSEDIASAIEAFTSNLPGLQKVALWGLCGGAADSILYAARDPRVVGIALINPWSYDVRVRGLTALRRYGTRSFQKVHRWVRSAGILKRVAVGADGTATGGESSKVSQDCEWDGAEQFDLPPRTNAAVDLAYASYRSPDLSKRLAVQLAAFKGGILFIFGGKDAGSQLFKHSASISLRWRRLLSARRVQCRDLPAANHSLRRPEWRAQAAAWTLEWLLQLRHEQDSVGLPKSSDAFRHSSNGGYVEEAGQRNVDVESRPERSK
jgi:exosortase A-associated hydrolase 1